MADPKPEATVIPASTAVVQPDVQPQGSQQPVRLKDVRSNKDGRGVPATQILWLSNLTNTHLSSR